MVNQQFKFFALAGSITCLLAVVIGAFGAHALSELLVTNQRESVFELASRYQYYHGLGLLAIAALIRDNPSATGLNFVALSMVLGMLVFCGSLYLLAITNQSWLGAITPLGGVALVLAWARLSWLLYRSN